LPKKNETYNKDKQHRLSEVKGMADRIINMRSTLFDLLKEVGSSKDWKHIKSQIGMFAYLVGLPFSSIYLT